MYKQINCLLVFTLKNNVLYIDNIEKIIFKAQQLKAMSI